MKKYTAIFLMLIITCCILTACNSNSTANQQNNIEAETEEQTTVIAEEVTEVTEESTPEPTEEPTPEPTAEPVEMVSWEEWASQPGEEEPHLVVWNEEKGKQLIIEPGSIYTMEDGDRLAVSDLGLKVKDEDMSAVVIVRDGETITPDIIVTDYGQYWNIDIPKGESDIVYTFKDQSYCYYIE